MMSIKEPAICKIRKVKVFRGPVLARVALSGDWHLSPIVSEKQLRMLKAAFSKIRPELIILQGDLMDSPEEFQNPATVKKLERWLSLCSATAPTCLVLGGHDYIIPKDDGRACLEVLPTWREICEKTGVNLLLDDWFETEHVRIFGLFEGPEYCIRKDGRHENDPEEFEKKLLKLLKDKKLEQNGSKMCSEGKVSWFAAHGPEMTKASEELLALKFDVMSFGHTHGGCVPLLADDLLDALRLHGGLVSPAIHPLPTQVRGHQKVGQRKNLMKIINSGMVATQNCAPRPAQYLNILKAAEVTSVLLGQTR